MQPSSFFLLLFCFLLLFSASLISSIPPPQSPSLACKSTLYPKLCHSILSNFGSSPSNPYDYGKFSVKQCLKQAQRLSKVINHYLTHDKELSELSHEETAALADCRELTELSVDYLETLSSELKWPELMKDEMVERVKSLLSGIVTNQETCFDGLVESKSRIVSSLSSPLSNVTELYSVSLGLVTHALKKYKKNKKGGHEQRAFSNNGLHEPLEALIQALRKTKSSSGGRQLADLQGNGILINGTVFVSPDGVEGITSIGDAIAIAPNKLKPEDGYFIIYAREGCYEEYVVVPKHKKNILLIGDGINRTIITGNHSVVAGWTTFNSSTFAVSGERFIAVDITFRNTAGPEMHQAVAVRNNADLSTFYRCSFEGYQDTLYVHSLRQFYRECDIYGTVDFIFGNSAAVFQSCNLFARKPLPNQKNSLTAQGRTDPNQNTGISIHNCTIEAAPDLSMDLNSTLNYLGRPWKNYSRTVYMQSYIGNLIDPVGWLEWNGTIGLDTLYYGEFNNYGPGANTSMRVKWAGYNLMNVSQALNFTVYNFTMGYTWLPDTDIPFSGGLLY
ncbi:probable pectinesterase/pectinesterase inhibitor 25 isoform X2 [Manihot esculenta]|uniref:Pectinesterase n=1 Tax=Manihot esculenta TaxID=3983 RepID=A0A2C9V400_MANES|nr:probable pectinesterase/pectinesterase inhibitor 25 isoform X2 [Manihot esculenta]